MSVQVEHEESLVRAFILPQRRERYLEMIAKPKRRQVFAESLAHFKHLDMRFAVRIPPNQQHANDIAKILKSKGAPATCCAFSEWSEIDGRVISLDEALKTIVGGGMGTFLSCIPGRLAYFEDEDERWILERTGKS
jgi:hypothetical protein